MENEISVTSYTENEDGSAVITIECSDFIKSMLIEAGFLSLIQKHIDSLDTTEHLRDSTEETDSDQS